MKFKLLLLAYVSVLFIGCDSSGSNGPDPGKIELDLVFGESIRLWCGTSCSFAALSDGKYKIESKDPLIATAEAKGKEFTVKTKNPGETDIVITDNFGNRYTLKCYSRTFARIWEEAQQLDHFYKNSVNVEATDQSVAELIGEELKQHKFYNGYVYEFTEGTDRLSVRTRLPDPINGTYSCNMESRTLILNYDGRTEKYIYDILPAYPNFHRYTPRFIVALHQDFTAEYQSRYPDAGIRDVNTIRHIMASADYWLIARVGE